MLLIQQVTSDPLQRQTLILPDGSRVFLELLFRPQQQGWFINRLEYGSFVIRGLRICNNPNMLHQWKNVISFGLGCFSAGNIEPSLQQDFSSGKSKLYILTEGEVLGFAEFLANG